MGAAGANYRGESLSDGDGDEEAGSITLNGMAAVVAEDARHTSIDDRWPDRLKSPTHRPIIKRGYEAMAGLFDYLGGVLITPDAGSEDGIKDGVWCLEFASPDDRDFTNFVSHVETPPWLGIA